MFSVFSWSDLGGLCWRFVFELESFGSFGEAWGMGHGAGRQGFHVECKWEERCALSGIGEGRRSTEGGEKQQSIK